MSATFEEIQATALQLQQTVAAQNAKLDEIRAFIETLRQPGVQVTQEQIDQLAALLVSTASEAAANLAETDALDNP